MKKFKVIIEGRNFKILIEEEIKKCGFFTTRFVKVDSLNLVENEAFSMIRKELKGIVLNKLDDPPTLFIDQLNEISSFEKNQAPGTGFTWYLEDEKDYSVH